MASFTDLHLSNPSLKEKASALGFKKVFSPPLLVLSKQNDLNRIRDAKKNSEGGLCAVESVNGELLRSAARRGVLVSPLLVRGFGFDEGLIRSVADASAAGEATAFEISLFAFVRAAEMQRARLIAETRVFLKKCVKLKAPFALVSRAESVFDLKSPRECVAIGEILGLTFEQSARALGGLNLV
jgi:RNase P/RNase MRP subunit p30